MDISPKPALGRRPDDTLDLSRHTVILSVDDGYHSVYTNIYPLLKKYNMAITLGVICDYIRKGKPSYKPTAGFMKRDEIQELIDSCNIEIASHTFSHPFLTRLDSAAAWREIHNSKTVLESLFYRPTPDSTESLGVNVVTFVYPYGDMNAKVRGMVKRAGYKMGRAVRPGVPDLQDAPYLLPVVELRRETELDHIKHRISRRKTTILLIHQVVPEPAVFTQWNLADFTELMDWMHRARVRVITLDALYKEWWYRKLGLFMEEVAAAYPDRRKKLLFQDVDINATQAFHPR